MNAQRLILLVVICTCHLVGWSAELEDFEGCSTLVDASEKLDCFERITRILVDERAAGANSPAKMQGESGKVPAIVESVSEAKEAAQVPSDFGKRENSLEATNISSVVVDVKKSKVKKNIYVLTLANRQVWRETQFGKGTSYRSGDGVTIKVSRMGSFVLTNRRTGFSCHVRRIN